MTSAPAHRSHLETLAALPLLEGLSRIEPGVVVLDRRGHIAWVSDALVGGREHSRAVAGRDWREFVREPKLGDALWQRLERDGGVWSERVDVETLDGRALAVEVHAIQVCRGSEDGAIVALVRRLHEGNRIAEEFGRTVEYLSAILDSSPDPVLVVDQDGKVKYASRVLQAVLGWLPGEVVGRPAADLLVHARDVERLESTMRPHHRVSADFESHRLDVSCPTFGTCCSRKAICSEFELFHRDGSTRWVALSANPLRLRDGTIVGTVAFLRDETERRSFKRSLERKNAELEHTVHTVSHDLRAPLVSVLGFSRLLRDEYGDSLDEQGGQFLRRIEEAGRTMEGLIRELLDFSRISQGAGSASLVDPRQVLLQLEAELKTRLEEQGARLEIPSAPPLIRCERTRLYQIFSNLIGNAFEHMGACREPRVVVEVTEEADHWHLIVRDNGRGIDPANHERIFAMFQTLPEPDGRTGTGIGLSIVKKIAEVQGGQAWVESRLGEGAAFHVTLARR